MQEVMASRYKHSEIGKQSGRDILLHFLALTKAEYLPQADTISPPAGSGQEGSRKE